MLPFWEFFTINLKLIYRNFSGVFWTVLVPVAIYCALSVLPLQSITGVSIPYSDYLLPGLIAMVVMQGGIYTLAYAVIEFRARGVMKRFAVTPVTRWQFVLSLMVARLTIVVAQVIVLTLVGLLVFNAEFSWPILTILALVILGGAIFLLLGLVISTFAKSYEAAAPITSAIGLPLTFLGDIFYPIEKLPGALQEVSKVLPITYMADGLRQAYLDNAGFVDLGLHWAVLVAWLAALFALVMWRFRLD
jgi:ABC-2 type transport system permease protein